MILLANENCPEQELVPETFERNSVKSEFWLDLTENLNRKS